MTDIPSLLAIYNHSVMTSNATFDIAAQTLDERESWFLSHGPRHPIIVAERDDLILGYASLAPFRSKPAYAATTESSVYIDERYWGKGIGRALMLDLLGRAQALGHHVVVAGIVRGNSISQRLHESLGFDKIGCFQEVGYKFQSWQDICFYQRIIIDKNENSRKF
jgi:L-amino acid N-acyltransferase YncA